MDVVDHKDRDSAPDYKDPEEEYIDSEHLEEIMAVQPTINIMTLGHVAHGKSTLMRALGWENTQRHIAEIKNNMTIHLGYTSCKIFYCPQCPRPRCYAARPSADMECFCEFDASHGQMRLIRHFSFVDCPGHAHLMGTMLSGASVVDGAALVIDASQECPARQTDQHLAAATLLGVAEHMVVAQNKTDLVTEKNACLNHAQIVEFLRRYGKERVPIIPICAQQRMNVDAFCMAAVDHIPMPRRNLRADLLMSVIRSFDVNKPGVPIDQLEGGVAGCVIAAGVLTTDIIVEIRPGVILRKGKTVNCYPIRSKVVSAMCGTRALEKVYPGANVGVGLTIDPFLTKKNLMVGHMIGLAGSPDLPDVFVEAQILVAMLPKTRPFSAGEMIKVNIGSYKGQGKVHPTELDGRPGILCKLDVPCCAPIASRIAITRKYEAGKEGPKWELDGGGVLYKVKPLPLSDISELGRT